MDNQHSHAQNDSNNQIERERIIKDLDNYLKGTERSSFIIADWHLAEVKRIVEPLDGFNKTMRKLGFMPDFIAKEPIAYSKIKETLKRANGGESLTPTGSEQ